MKKKIIASLATIGLVSALVGGATFAIFTDTASNENNTFKAGTVDISAGLNAAWTLGADNLAPGDSKTAQITVTNEGTLDLRYDVAETVYGDLFSVQGVSGEDTPAYTEYKKDGVPFTPGDNNFDLAPGESDIIEVTLTLPLTAGNEYQGDEGNLGLAFNAEQTKNNPIPE